MRLCIAYLVKLVNVHRQVFTVAFIDVCVFINAVRHRLCVLTHGLLSLVYDLGHLGSVSGAEQVRFPHDALVVSHLLLLVALQLFCLLEELVLVGLRDLSLLRLVGAYQF